MVSTMKDQCQDIRMLPSHAELPPGPQRLLTEVSTQVLLLILPFWHRRRSTKVCSKSREAPPNLPKVWFHPILRRVLFPYPWDSPGKNTGVGCHFLLQCMKVKSEREVTQSYLTPRTPWTTAYQAPLFMGFSRQQYWGGVPLPSPSIILLSKKLTRYLMVENNYHIITLWFCVAVIWASGITVFIQWYSVGYWSSLERSRCPSFSCMELC